MSPYLGKAQQPQEQRYPFLSVSAVFSCVRTVVRLSVSAVCSCVRTVVRLSVSAVCSFVRTVVRLSVSAVCSCVRTVLWLPVFEIFNVSTDVEVRDSTQGLYGHRKRVCTES